MIKVTLPNQISYLNYITSNKKKFLSLLFRCFFFDLFFDIQYGWTDRRSSSSSSSSSFPPLLFLILLSSLLLLLLHLLTPTPSTLIPTTTPILFLFYCFLHPKFICIHLFLYSFIYCLLKYFIYLSNHLLFH